MLGAAAFQREFLKRDLWLKQIEICNAYEQFGSVSIAGCHGSGKTFVVSGIVAFELLGHEDAVVLTVAPTLRQVKTFWREIRTTAASLPRLAINGRMIPPPDTTKWEISERVYAQGFSASASVNAQGFHGKRVLILADEAIGITPEVWEAIEGIRSAGDVRIIKMLNPTVPEGPVYEDFTRNLGMRGHKAMHISAFDTPNLIDLRRDTEEHSIEALMELDDEGLSVCRVGHLTRRRWVAEMVRKWGPTNPRFVSRVLGRFPDQATDAVFQLSWVDRAGTPYEAEELAKQSGLPGVYIQIGIDVAGPGDDETAACARLGHFVLDQDAWVKADALDDVEKFISRQKARFPRARIILVGDTVGTGYHFMRALARKRYEVWPFIAGAKPVDTVMFKNAKAEQYWLLREWMKGGFVHGVLDEDCQAQLSDVRYRELPGGQIEIEHKDEARKRGSSSPDRAEALVMAYARLTPAQQTVVFGGDYQISLV